MGEELKEAAHVLPAYPEHLSAIEWVAVCFVAVVAIVLLFSCLRTIPRALQKAQDARAKQLEDAAKERKEQLEAAAHERRNDLQAFTGQLEMTRLSHDDAMNRVLTAHENAVNRIHDRIDGLDRSVQGARRDILRLSCFPGAPQTADVGAWPAVERRAKPRTASGG